ncbi:MAG: hypothetical protein DRR19_07515 [Candidatus Parabeggiatoa sp. nov. 1]|nr:MAG: hypothetical protein DRR19_07515 [Gammaproteobacteria bacterium]
MTASSSNKRMRMCISVIQLSVINSKLTFFCVQKTGAKKISPNSKSSYYQEYKANLVRKTAEEFSFVSEDGKEYKANLVRNWA